MNKNELSKYNPATEFLLYKTANGEIKVDVLLQNETIWMPQKKIAELFDVNVPAISKHLKNIFESGELNKEVVVSILEIPTKHGAIKEKTQKNKTKFYNLDYAEHQAEKGVAMTMKDWVEKLGIGTPAI